MQQRHVTESDTFTSSKNFFSNHILNIFMFTSSVISNNNNNTSHLPILQTQTHQNNSSKLDITQNKKKWKPIQILIQKQITMSAEP